MKKISIVIPVYNSEKTIGEVIKRLDEQFEKLNNQFSFEVILVNDGSTDDVLSVCKSIIKEKENVKLINFSKNFGQPSAMLAGFKFSTGDYVISMDDDLQTPPSEIDKLITKIETSNYDLIYAKYKEKKHSWFRNLGSKLNALMAQWLIGKPRNIRPSSFFITKKFIVEEMVNYDGPYPYIAGLIFRTTQSIGDVKVEHQERIAGESNYNLRKLISLWLNGFTSFSVKPLRLSSLIGVLFALVGFLWMGYIIAKKLLIPDIKMGWTSLMSAVVFFGGLQLVSLGLIGEYVGRIFLSINKAPQYVIKEIYNIKR